MNGFSDLFSAYIPANEAENGELGDTVGCGLLPFDEHGSSASFAQAHLFSANFPFKEAKNGELCYSVECGLLPFDGHGFSASFAQADLFSTVFTVKEAEIGELCDRVFDGHGSLASSGQADCKLFRDNPSHLTIAEGCSGKAVDKISSSCASERARRKRMRSCFSDLASLLPPQNNNTKRKTSNIDIVSKAMDYICHLKKKVDRLSKKRDEMKMKISDHQVVNYSYSSYKDGNEFPMVKVDHVCSHVLITTNTLREHMVLSKILVVIEEQDLQLITASTFAIHDKVTHTLHCKVSRMKILHNNIKLGQKIWQIIKEMYIPL